MRYLPLASGDSSDVDQAPDIQSATSGLCQLPGTLRICLAQRRSWLPLGPNAVLVDSHPLVQLPCLGSGIRGPMPHSRPRCAVPRLSKTLEFSILPTGSGHYCSGCRFLHGIRAPGRPRLFRRTAEGFYGTCTHRPPGSNRLLSVRLRRKVICSFQTGDNVVGLNRGSSVHVERRPRK